MKATIPHHRESSSRRAVRYSLAALLGFSAAVPVALADSVASGPDAGAMSMGDMHAHHHPSSTAEFRRSEATYEIPAVTLVREDGHAVSFPAELDDGRPVVLNFIYTSCTTICPLSSQIFEQFEDDLGSARGSIHLVSISIDPEQDTPARLREYAARFHADHAWNHYSGSLASIIAVQKAFNAYRGDKMNHTPLTLMRSAPGKAWVRFDGFARADDLMAARKSWGETTASIVR